MDGNQSSTELYFIQDTRTICGNAVMWWCPEGKGYTSNLNKAWRVSKEKAFAQHRSRPTDVPWPVDAILAGAFPIFDFQYLRDIPKPSAVPSREESGE